MLAAGSWDGWDGMGEILKMSSWIYPQDLLFFFGHIMVYPMILYDIPMFVGYIHILITHGC